MLKTFFPYKNKIYFLPLFYIEQKNYKRQEEDRTRVNGNNQFVVQIENEKNTQHCISQGHVLIASL